MYMKCSLTKKKVGFVALIPQIHLNSIVNVFEHSNIIFFIIMAKKYIFTKSNLEFLYTELKKLKEGKLVNQKSPVRLRDKYLKFSELYKRAQQNNILMTRGSFAWFAHRVLKIITIQSNVGPWIIGTENNQGIVHMASYMRAMHEYDVALWDGQILSIIPYSQYALEWAIRWQDGYGPQTPGEFVWPRPDQLAKKPFP